MSKTKSLSNLIKSLSYYEGCALNCFVCPVCLKSCTPSAQSQNPISRAHIIPKAAGGTHVTYICTRCNSYLGRKQDKWFGDFFRLCAENKSVLETSQKGGQFKLAGIPVNGRWTFDPKFGFQVAIHNNRNSPATLNALDKLAESGAAESSEMKFSIPLITNTKAVGVGLLTAAYLSWFRELGYSFAFQSHLDPIRRQILNPDKITPNVFGTAQISDVFFKDPLCVIAELDGDYFLTSLIGNVCIFFPAVDSSDQKRSYPVGNVKIQYQRIRLFNKHNFGPPVVLAIADRTLVMPDQLFDKYKSGYMIYFQDFKSKPQQMFFTSESEIEEIANRENADIIKSKHIIPFKRKPR